MKITFQPLSPSPLLRGHLNMGDARVQVTSRYLERDGRPFLPVMGEYHFCRDRREHWRRELAKMKAGGVTVVATYLFWIYHEEIEGAVDFSGDLDIRAFVLACQEQGLDVALRIGPWAHGECRNGGFPDWLLQKGWKLRTNDERYLRRVKAWYAAIFGQVRGLFYKDGGPIVAVQLENELVDDAEHLLALKRMAREIGFDAPLWTVTGWNSLYGARIPVDEVLPVFGAYVEAPWAEGILPQPLSPHYAFDPVRNDAAIGKDLLRPVAPDGWRLPYERYPFATCELGCGLQSTHHRRVLVSGMDAYALSLVKLGCGNNLIGYYMYHGGVNKLGRRSTLQESRATGYPNDLPILDYDFRACLGQWGQAREQYRLLNLLHLFAQDLGAYLAPMAHVPAKDFVPCTDLSRLRCALRADGERGFVFVNHYQRRAKLADVFGAEISALGIDLPPMDVKGDSCFFLPLRLPLDDAVLKWATAQPLCRAGDVWFFMEIPGVPPAYCLEAEGKETVVRPQAGLNAGFPFGGSRIVTLTWDEARFLRRLDGKLFVGCGCDLYALDGEIRSVTDGSFSYYEWTGAGFVPHAAERPFVPAALILEEAAQPFDPPYAEELRLGGARPLRWLRARVTSPEGMVAVAETYDAAQLYADGELVADHFFDGAPWELPAALLHGKDCYFVLSALRDDCYLEYRAD